MNKKYSDAQLMYLRRGYMAWKMRIPELTVAFNNFFGMDKTEGQIRSTLKNHKFKCGKRPASDEIVSKLFTPEQIAFIREQYRQHDIKTLSGIFNARFGTTIKQGQLKSFIHNHGITSGRTGWFEKGNKSWNEGTRGVMKANSGSFKKGDVPATTQPLGHERICAKDGYIMVKVAEENPFTGAPTRFKAKQLLVWEAKHGPVPKGMLVTFIDGDPLNCDIDNLEMISRAENLQRNRLGLNKFPAEFRDSLRALAKMETVRFGMVNNKGMK